VDPRECADIGDRIIAGKVFDLRQSLVENREEPYDLL
jgi:hypothetical protein